MVRSESLDSSGNEIRTVLLVQLCSGQHGALDLKWNSQKAEDDESAIGSRAEAYRELHSSELTYFARIDGCIIHWLPDDEGTGNKNALVEEGQRRCYRAGSHFGDLVGHGVASAR